MKRNVIIDTGALVALLNKKDTYHQWAVAQLKNIQPPLLTCDAVMSEMSFLIGRQQPSIAVIFNYLNKQGIALIESLMTEHCANGGMIVLTSHHDITLHNDVDVLRINLSG